MKARAKPSTKRNRSWKRGEWESAPNVFVVMPPCPGCHGFNYRRTKSRRENDGSVTQKMICKNKKCRKKFNLIFDLPDDEPTQRGNSQDLEE